MATVTSILDRVRLELGDQPRSFRQQWFGDGATDRWVLDYAPVRAADLHVSVAHQDVSDACEVEEPTGTLVLDVTPNDQQEVVVSGFYFRYFTDDELLTLIDSAVSEHLRGRTDAYGQVLTLQTLPFVEEGILALGATIKALYVLATDSSFDIDIFTPDGVSIPRSQRYRQLMEMIESRKEQHKQACEALNIGLGRMEVFTLRRISKWTNRYVPVYRPQEIDDRSKRERVYLPIPTYGATPAPQSSTSHNLVFTQGDTVTRMFDYSIDLTGYTVRAQIRTYPENPTVAAEFTVTVNDAATGIITLALTSQQTRALPLRCWWDMQIRSGETVTTVMHGQVTVNREVTRV